MKFFSTLVIALLLGLGVYAIRRRVWLALRVAGITYLVVLPIRLLFSAGDLGDRLDSLVWPAFGVLVAWLILWRVSLAYERRKKSRSKVS